MLDSVEGLWLTTNCVVWHTLQKDQHTKNGVFFIFINFEQQKESICSSIRKMHKTVPNVHLHLMSSAHEMAEKLHETCKDSAKKPGTQYTAKNILLFP